MITYEFMKRPYDFNLSYLLLAQRLINDERDSAIFRLAIDDMTADTLSLLTLSQMLELAETDLLMFPFRFNDHNTIDHLTKVSRIDDLQQIHTGLLLSGRLLQDKKVV